jgi:hypothetical protein
MRKIQRTMAANLVTVVEAPTEQARHARALFEAAQAEAVFFR